LEEVSASKVSQDIARIEAAFEYAKKEGLIPANPCEPLRALRVKSQKRKAFSLEQVRSLVEAAKGTDWETMILLGAYAGTRIADAATMSWENVDLAGEWLTFTPAKTAETTGKVVKTALAPDLLAHLNRIAGDASGPLCPTLCKSNANGKLSSAFKRVMEKAGISQERVQLKGREFSQLSFHSLRYTCVSNLSAAGVSIEVRRDTIGHSSDAQNLHYTETRDAALRAAALSLPRL
jgi:integrase